MIDVVRRSAGVIGKLKLDHGGDGSVVQSKLQKEMLWYRACVTPRVAQQMYLRTVQLGPAEVHIIAIASVSIAHLVRAYTFVNGGKGNRHCDRSRCSLSSASLASSVALSSASRCPPAPRDALEGGRVSSGDGDATMPIVGTGCGSILSFFGASSTGSSDP